MLLTSSDTETSSRQVASALDASACRAGAGCAFDVRDIGRGDRSAQRVLRKRPAGPFSHPAAVWYCYTNEMSDVIRLLEAAAGGDRQTAADRAAVQQALRHWQQDRASPAPLARNP